MKASIARRCDVRVRPFDPAARQEHIIRQTRHLAHNNGDRSAEDGGCSGGVIVRTITRQVSSSCAFDTTTQQLIGENECLKVRVRRNTTNTCSLAHAYSVSLHISVKLSPVHYSAIDIMQTLSCWPYP